MKALGKKVIVAPLKKEETESGVLLASGSKEPVKRGKIVSIGSLVTSVEEGDVVIFSPVYYDEIDSENLIMNEEDLWATE